MCKRAIAIIARNKSDINNPRVCMCVLSYIQLFATAQFSKQRCWSGLPFPTP